MFNTLLAMKSGPEPGKKKEAFFSHAEEEKTLSSQEKEVVRRKRKLNFFLQNGVGFYVLQKRRKKKVEGMYTVVEGESVTFLYVGDSIYPTLKRTDAFLRKGKKVFQKKKKVKRCTIFL